MLGLTLFGSLDSRGELAPMSMPLLVPMVVVPPPLLAAQPQPLAFGSLAAAAASGRASVRSFLGSQSPPRVLLAVFTALFLYAAADFLRRGLDFVDMRDRQNADIGSSSASSFGPSKHRDMRFHLLAVAAVLAEAMAYALELCSVPSYAVLPWLYGSRILSSVLLLVAVCVAGGAAKSADSPHDGGSRDAAWSGASTAAALALGAWAQLVVAESAPQLALRWGLFFSGVTSGCIALSAVSATIEGVGVSEPSVPDKLREKAEVPLGLLWFCCTLYAFLWLPTGGFQPLGPTVSVLLTGLLDVVMAIGTGHLLLKREQLMDKALLPKAQGPSFEGRL